MKNLILITSLIFLVGCGDVSIDPRLAPHVDIASKSLELACGFNIRQDINYRLRSLPGSTYGRFEYDFEDRLKSEVNILIDSKMFEANSQHNYIVEWVIIHELAHSAGLKHFKMTFQVGYDLMSDMTNYDAIAHIDPLSSPDFLIELCIVMKNNRIDLSNSTHIH